MISIVSFAVLALVSLQCAIGVNAQLKLENNLQPNVIPKRRTFPKFVSIAQPPPDTVRFEPGTKLELQCMVMGKPAPSVEWLRNGEPIDQYEDEINDILPESEETIARLNSKIIITSAQDGDQYTCLATAGLKQKTATTTVYTSGLADEDDIAALEKMFGMPSKPVITQHYFDVFATAGSDIVLPCRVYGSGEMQVFWHGPEGNLLYGDSRIRVLPSGDLLIRDLRWADMGNLTCTAKNAYGSESVTTFLYPVKPKA